MRPHSFPWILGLFALVSAAGAADAAIAYRIRMNTAAWSGRTGYIVISITSGVGGRDSVNQVINIRNFTGNAVRGQTLTTGGGNGGDLIYELGSAPAPITTLAPMVKTSRRGDQEAFFYSHLGVNLALRANAEMEVPGFRDSVVFDIVLPEPATVRRDFQDQVAIHVLDASNQPAFPTGDPLGCDALCAFTASPSPDKPWRVELFSPATFSAARGDTPATIHVDFPAPGP